MTDADIFEHIIEGIRVRLQDRSGWDVVEQDEGTFTESSVRVKIRGDVQSSVASETATPEGKVKR